MASEDSGYAAPVDYFYAGASSLAEQLDHSLLIILRDGRHLVGCLRAYDHFGSLVLEDAKERHFAAGRVCDLPMGGIYLVRGENVAIVAELDPSLDASNPLLTPAEWEDVQALEGVDEDRAQTALAAGAPVEAVTAGTRTATSAPTIAKLLWALHES